MFPLYNIMPTELSQTTNNIELIVKTEMNNLGFFDSDAPTIESSADDWKKVSDEVLNEHAELWEKLAKL